MIGIDLIEIDPIEGVEFKVMNFHDADAPERLREWLGGPADGVMSDMAANATGHRKTDHLRIVGLAEIAVDFACSVLAPGGFFIAKVLQGGSEGDLLARLKREFAPCVTSSRRRAGRTARRCMCWRRGFGEPGNSGGYGGLTARRFFHKAALRVSQLFKGLQQSPLRLRQRPRSAIVVGATSRAGRDVPVSRAPLEGGVLGGSAETRRWP